MTQFRLVPMLAFASLCAGVAAPALAQPYCFPPAETIPGLSGPPTNITDPRWNGALLITPTGDVPATTAAYSRDDYEFRAVTYNAGAQKYLVLSWRVNINPNAQQQAVSDYIYAYFRPDDATSAGNAIVVQPLASKCAKGCSALCGALAVGILKYNADGSHQQIALQGFSSGDYHIDNMPPWLLENTLLDLECTGPSSAPVCDAWTVTMKIPVSATATADNPTTGLNLPDAATFRFAQDMKVYSIIAPSVSWTTNPFTWPHTNSPGDLFDSDTLRPATDLTTVKLNTRAGCSNGVWIDSSMISVVSSGTAGTGGTQIDPNGPNTFHAKPKNDTGGNIPNQAVSATFRMANWGSVSTDDSQLWQPVRGCDGKTMAAGPDIPGTPAGSFDITCDWTPLPEEGCLYRTNCPADCAAGTPASACRNIHQCIYVELKKTQGSTVLPSFFFSRMSAYQNMNFIHASEVILPAKLELFQRPAVAGAAAREPRQRDTYIYVRTQGMPEKVTAPLPKQLARPEVMKPFRDAKLVAKLDKLGVREGKIGKEVADVLKEQMKLGKIGHREVAAVLPTYVAYVWQDTGKTTRVKGKTVKVFQSMPSFGYYVSHDGPLTGWRNGLSGKGVTKVGPNFYKVSVPAKGGLAVNSWLRACEDESCLTAKPPK